VAGGGGGIPPDGGGGGGGGGGGTRPVGIEEVVGVEAEAEITPVA